MLTAVAEITDRVEPGALVTRGSYRNPNLLADMARSIDHISGGRMILGVGSGWSQKDYDEYGYEFGPKGRRLRDLDRAIPIIKERSGKLNPPPVCEPLPILIGGSREKVTLRIVGKYAHIWNGFGDPQRAEHLSGVLGYRCKEGGRDPAEIELSITVRDAKQMVEYMKVGITHLVMGFSGPSYDLAPLADLMIAWRDRQRSIKATSGG